MRRLAIVAVTLLLAAGCQFIPGHSGAAAGSQGRIVWPKDGDLWVLDLASKQQTKIVSLPRGAAVTGATWSPDGTKVIYSQFWRRPNERASGADLFIANADGSNVQPFVERDAPNTVLDTPQWAASGRVYYTQRKVENGRENDDIVRRMPNGQPEVMVQNAAAPAVSPDESTLVYLRITRAGQVMMKKQIGEAGDGCELMSDQVFQALNQVRFSPDGMRLAFGGSGDPTPGPSGCGGASAGQPSASGQPGAGGQASASAGPPPAILLGQWLNLLPTPAYAHGLPWDVWSMNLDGSGLTRIADLKEDEPTVAWAPDGTKVAIFGVAGLYVVDSKGSPPDKIVDQGGYGGLDWAK